MRLSADADLDAAAMTRLTIVGAGTSAPQPETPASGVLVETKSTAILLDIGQGVVRSLMAHRDPRELDAIVVGHMHADHYIDLISLRYLMPWAGYTGRRIPVLLPPGGRTRIEALATAISERAGFFDDTFDIREYDPAAAMTIGDLTLGYLEGRHYVPAWGCTIGDAHGRRIVMSGDTGPTETLLDAARGADVLIVEATLLTAAEDDVARGHLTLDEAIEAGARSGAARTVLVHHRPQNREAILAAVAAHPGAALGLPGLAIELGPSAASPVILAPPSDGSEASTEGQFEADPAAGIASSASRARWR
jgi:ribonuclease BN (tRNA processing enzyme)